MQVPGRRSAKLVRDNSADELIDAKSRMVCKDEATHETLQAKQIA